MLSSYIQVYVGIDWNLDGTYTDESAFTRKVGIQRGRSDANDAFSAGTGNAILSNRTGRFSPYNTSSALYPNVLPGRPIKIEATYNAVTYPIFLGFATPTFPTRAIDSEITLNLIDVFDKWSKPPLTNTDIATDVLNSDLMIEILDDIGFSALDRNIDQSENALAYWTNHNRLPLNGLRLLASENAGGYVFMEATGIFRFENMSYRSAQQTFVTLAGTFESLTPELRFDDLINRVRVTYPRFQVTAEAQAAYTLNPVGKPLVPGANSFIAEFSGLGVFSAIEPIAVTDYTGNSAPDGTGVDKTAQLSVSSFTTTGGEASITIDNLDGSVIYLDYFQVRGFIVESGNETSELNVSTLVPLVSFSKYEKNFEVQESEDVLQAYAEYTAEKLGHLTSRIVCSIVPDTDSLMAAVLSSNMSKRVRLTDTGAPWLTQINADYIIEQIQLSFDAGMPNKVSCDWLLFDEWLGEANGFIINDDIATDWPDSVIALDGATDGKVIFK